MNVIVGKRYRFKENLDLTGDVAGKFFNVVSINQDQKLIFIKFDDDRQTYNIDFENWDKMVVISKWQGSKIVFNFV